MSIDEQEISKAFDRGYKAGLQGNARYADIVIALDVALAMVEAATDFQEEQGCDVTLTRDFISRSSALIGRPTKAVAQDS